MFNKYTLIFLVATIVVATALTEKEQFEDFKKKFNKSYATPEEEANRFEIFKKTLQHIEENNAKFAKGEVTHTEGVNQFADLTPDELARSHGIRLPQQ